MAVSKLETVEDTRWLLTQAEEHDFIRGVVGALDEFQTHPKFRGVVWNCEGEIPEGLAEIERRGLTLDVHPRLEIIPRICEKFPALKIAIDHVTRAAMPFDDWARALETAAQSPNVFAKLSGLITGIPGQWKAEQLQPYARHVLRVFGPERVMYGSDWPSYLPEGTWKEALAAFTQAIGAQTEETREHLLGGTACRFYGVV